MSKKVYYNKLIRDRIPEKIKKAGADCEVREITEDDEFEQELLKKVSEEASSLSKVRSREDFLDEYADLMVVLDEICRLREYSEADIKEAIAKNLEKKGGFQSKLFLNWSSDSGYKSNETPQGIKKN